MTDLSHWSPDELALYLRGWLEAKDAPEFVLDVLADLQNRAVGNEDDDAKTGVVL